MNIVVRYDVKCVSNSLQDESSPVFDLHLLELFTNQTRKLAAFARSGETDIRRLSMGHNKIAIMRHISLAQRSFLHHICGSHESHQKLASPVLAWTELPAKEQRLKQQLLKLKPFNRFNDL